jgi:threonylcarbamoyladenosine tRNA methylthiotransferase MtaB
MPQVPQPVRKLRAGLLRQAGERFAAAYLQTMKGQVVSVLTESDVTGHTEHFAQVRLREAVPQGRIVAARITEAMGDTLLAEAA